VETSPELTTKVPKLIEELQELSRQYPFNNDIPSRDKVINSLANLKNRKASNDIPPVILQHAKTECLECIFVSFLFTFLFT